MLKDPKDPRGYTSEEIKEICKKYKIHWKKFKKAFGCNTCIVAEDNTPRFYKCDVERALYTLGCKDGRFHIWD